MSKKLKAVESSVQPNHKEVELWITPTNNDGSKEVKYWNSKAQQWSKCEGEGNGGDVEAAAEYYRIDWDKAIELGYKGLSEYVDTENVSKELQAISEPYGTIKMIISFCSLGNVQNRIIPIGIISYQSEVMPGWVPLNSVTKVCFKPTVNTTDNGIIETYFSLNDILKEPLLSPFKDCFIPCTKEEFYALT